jgi:hypothetical protein
MVGKLTFVEEEEEEHSSRKLLSVYSQ